jgi:dTMP kinase
VHGLTSVRAQPTTEGSHLRLFGSGAFFRLWLGQVASSLGDWVGIVAITALSYRIGGASATGFTLAARFVPGFFLAPFAGVLVDRFDRKRVMVSCDVGRAALLCLIPLTSSVWELVLVSFLLELLTLLWSPAKDASVPNLVPPGAIPTVGSLSMAAAYGTFPLAAGISAGLFKLTDRLAAVSWLHLLRGERETVAIGFDVLSFLVSAALISTLPLRHERVVTTAGAADAEAARRRTVAEMRVGMRFIRSSPIVKAVMIGMGTGLVGGGLVIPLGRVFAARALRAGDAGYGLLLTALGTGAAAGVLGVISAQKRVPRELVFCMSVLGAATMLLLTAAMSSLALAAWCVAGFGICAGAAFVLGQTILQMEVEDALRGRVFATFYALIRLALTLPLVLGPFASSLLDRVSRWLFGRDETAAIGSSSFFLPGVRLTLWSGALVVYAAAFFAFRTVSGHAPDLAESSTA